MPKKSDLIRRTEAEISRLESNIKKLDEQAFKQRAEVKAYRNMIEWANSAKGDKDAKK